MSSKRNKSRSANHTASQQGTLQQLSTRAFEELQMRHLQVMLSHLANKAYLSLGKPNEELQKEALAPIRMYAQYLNLYMKFKDKCFPGEELKAISPSLTPTQSAQKESTNTEPKKQPTPFQPAPFQPNQPKAGDTNPPNRLQQTNNTNALLMPPTNSTQTKQKENESG